MQYEMPFCTKISLPTEAAVADHHVVAMLAAKQPCFGACLGCVELQFCIAARARNVKHMHAVAPMKACLDFPPDIQAASLKKYQINHQTSPKLV